MIVTDTLFSKLLKSFVAFCAIATLGITASTPAFADQTSKSLDVNLTLGNSISVRILDSTATSDLSLLSFDLTPTAAGVTSTKRAIVDVSTSNITGYKLYVEANGKDHNNQYTTDLVQGDTADSHVIPTSTSTASNKNFWNYVNPATSAATVVPAHGNPDQIGMLMSPTTSTKANVDINVGVDTTITAGSYTNQLLFTAIANPDSIGYTLDFNSNLPSGADPSTLQNFPANQAASSSAVSYTFTIPSTTPTLAGYDLVHYQNANDSAETYSPGDTVTVNADPSSSTMSGSKTLNAIWSNITYDIAFDANEPSGTTATGSTASMTNLDYNTSYNLTTNGYAIAGHSFQGWCTVAVANPVVDSSACATASGTYYADGASVQGLTETSGSTVTMYALWTINSNTVTVTAGTGIASTTGSGDYDYGTTVTVGYTESAGYHFTGWTTVSGGVTVDANNQFTMPDNDVSVTANGAINTCTIHYNVNTPSDTTSSGSTADSSFNYNTSTATTANGFSATGYNWAGWAESATGSAIITTSGGSITAAQAASWCGTHGTTKQLYAKWIKKYTYTLNLNTNDGTTNKQILNYPSSGGTTDTSHQFTSLNTYAPTREGYNFLGWATTSTGTSYVTSYTLNSSSASSIPTTAGFPVTGNLYAQWELASYTITISNTNTSSGSASISVPYGGSNTVTVTPNTGHYLSSVSCPSGYTCTGYSTGTSATGQQTVTVTNNNTAGGGTLGFVGTARTFTVSVSNNHTTSGANSISVPYGGSNTVTVVANAGYYLSSVSCPSGYSCTGYSTGTSAIGQQTVTVTNNGTMSGGTLAFTGGELGGLLAACDRASLNGTFSYSNIEFIKLKMNQSGSTYKCYTKTSQGTATFDNAATLCPSGTGVPSQSEFQSLINAYGSDGTIYNTTGWSGYYWSSTSLGSSTAAFFVFNSSNADHGYTSRTASYRVVCVARY